LRVLFSELWPRYLCKHLIAIHLLLEMAWLTSITFSLACVSQCNRLAFPGLRNCTEGASRSTTGGTTQVPAFHSAISAIHSWIRTTTQKLYNLIALQSTKFPSEIPSIERRALTSPTSDGPITFSTLSNLIESIVGQSTSATIHLDASDRNDTVTISCFPGSCYITVQYNSSQRQMSISLEKITSLASPNATSVTDVDQMLPSRTISSTTSPLTPGTEGTTPLPVCIGDSVDGSCSENRLCPNGRCCGKWGFCGSDLTYCGQDSKSQCDMKPMPRARSCTSTGTDASHSPTSSISSNSLSTPSTTSTHATEPAKTSSTYALSSTTRNDATAPTSAITNSHIYIPRSSISYAPKLYHKILYRIYRAMY
jgi:hypothetical protein